MRLGSTYKRKAWRSLLLVVLGVSLAFPTSSFAWEWVAEPPKTENHPWGVEPKLDPPGDRTIRIRTSAEYCSGEEKPVIASVNMASRGKRVVLRTYVRWPEPKVVSGEVKPDEPVPGCAWLVAYLYRTVKLPVATDEVKLFDGYYAPPRRRSVFRVHATRRTPY